MGIAGELMGRFLSPSPSRREFTGNFLDFPSFFSRELLYDGEVFGLKRELQGDWLGRNLRVFPRSL